MNWQSEFELSEKICYLNHAAVAPWPKRTTQAVIGFAKENSTLGASQYKRWLKKEIILREQLKSLIHAPSSNDIALVKNTSEALSIVAYGIQWNSGDNIIITDDEFPSNRIVWESLNSRGVNLKSASLRGTRPEQNIIDLIDSNTRLISVSSVQYASGIKLDLKKIGLECQNKKVLFCVDAIQSLGAETFDVTLNHAHFVVADGHKWMLGPEGLALFYCAREIQPQLSLNQFGWHMVEHPGDFDRTDWSPAKTAQRFECGSPNMLGIHALSASLSLILEVGLTEIEAQIQKKVSYLLEQLHPIPEITIHSPMDLSLRSGIINFTVKNGNHSLLHKQLVGKNVFCAHRGGGIRFSPHFYTPQNALTYAIDTLKQLISNSN
ncbi:MAG: aminotransferase [Moraxellaceae bacterium]|nr:MAG: aminotransferase [Moraxellaceae bacterium]